jgi:hypothetical protein
MSITSPGKGLQRDADTVALYKSVREFSPSLGPGIHSNGDGVFVDAAGNYNVQPVDDVVRVVNGPLGVAGALANPPQFARSFCSTSSGYIRGLTAINQAYNDAIRQSFTQQFVFNFQWDHTAARGIYGANNTAGAGAVNDFLARLMITATGGLNTFWESNDTNYGNTTSSLVLPINEWLVITVRWVVGTGYAIEYDVHRLNPGIESFYNEAFPDTGVLPLSTSGVGDSWIIYGRNENAAGSGPLIGHIAFGRIYKGVLTDQQVIDQAEELLTTGTLASVPTTNDLHRHEFNEPPDWIDESDNGLHSHSGSIVDYDAGLRHVDLVGSGGRARRNSAQTQRIGRLQADKLLAANFGPLVFEDFFNDTYQAVPVYTFQWVCLYKGAINDIIAYWEAASESLPTNYLVQFQWNTSTGGIDFFAERAAGTNITKTNEVTDGAQGTDRTDQAMLLTIRVGEKPGFPGTCRVRASVNDQLDIASFDMTPGPPQGGSAGTGLQWGGPDGGYLQEFKFSFAEISDSQILADFARLGDREGAVGGAGVTYRMRGYDTTLGRHVYWNADTVDTGGTSYGGPGPLTDIVLFTTIGQ